MNLSIETAISEFGLAAKRKLSNPAATGQPEDQLRAPFEHLIENVASICNFRSGAVIAVGESAQKQLKTRPDYSITVDKALVGFVELKAPGKGANPARFKDPHDKEQWERLSSLPNLLYCDGNSFGLWQDGKQVGTVLTLQGDIESAGAKLAPPPGLLLLLESFLRWKPVAPRNARELAHTTARLCRLLRNEVTEQLGLKSQALTDLATDWRKLLFPDASDERFADGYAQAVTFGMLMARAKQIPLRDGLQKVAAELARSSTLIGTALRLLTDSAENQETLKTGLSTLTRVLDAVDWNLLTKGEPEAWLYFYEEFLDVYDKDLRKETGSYYTPPEVVGAMVSLVDEALRSKRFGLHAGLASPSVTLADPAMGTGTFLLGVIRRIADTVGENEGPGAVAGAIQAALSRLIGFEMQLGPFAVAQLRLLAEVVDLTGATSDSPLRIFVTDTLGDPYEHEDYFPSMLAALGRSRRDANKIKREEPITVVLGNPPYKEKAKGRGGWIEHASPNKKDDPPLQAWMPPAEWHAGAHSKHLRNLYIYFWRWATWKVFDHQPAHDTGIVCFITVAGFLAGPGFQKMRDYLRRTCDDIWVIDCSPERHQPEVNTRIFQGVQQPVCIVMVSRSKTTKTNTPAKVHFRALPLGKRETKFDALSKIRLEDREWIEAPSEWRAPFLPVSQGAWSTYPELESLFVYNGSGVMPGRTWIIAPDARTLQDRWRALIKAPAEKKDSLLQPHLNHGEVGDRHATKILGDALAGFPVRQLSLAAEVSDDTDTIPYSFRSFDRQWIIPDKRVINRPNPELWQVRSDSQIFLTALTRTAPRNGPAVTFTALVPDLDHYRGSFGGRVFPLWRDDQATKANFPPNLLRILSERLGLTVTPEDLFSYIAAIVANPAYTARFQQDLSTPGLRIPITANALLFQEAVQIGRRVLWLQTFGERMADNAQGRPEGPPRQPVGLAPVVPKEGTISSTPEEMPDSLNYDAGKNRLLVGAGFIENVPPAVWAYEVSGKQVLVQWFSYRKKNRERPIIGDRRQPSPLGDIQPDHWLPEYTTELLNVLNVLAMLVELEPQQADLLNRICGGQLITETELKSADALGVEETARPRKAKAPRGAALFD
ncbi:MAG TPA: type ISP restriction/modification enzyme [Candidatus Acidoferrum sp.]|nr:type ISP restriction/modification enzyme [Candidatus Acidoferrum sp.]